MEERVAKTFSVRPNPSNGLFYLQLNNSNESIQSVSVLNLVGQEVYSANYSGESAVNAATLDLSGLVNGQYILRVNQNGTSLFSQIVLQK
jgi:hypothetical protein